MYTDSWFAVLGVYKVKKNLIQDSKVKACILFMAVIFFISIWYDVFTVQDGLMHYVWAQTGDLLESSWMVATSQGRIMYFIYNILSLVPYLFDNLAVYNMFSFATIGFCAYSLWRLLSRHWSREAGFLGLLLYFAFAQADWSHNFFVSYIVVLQGAIAFCLLSIERLLTYYKDKQKKYMIQSALFLVIASSTYESFILYSILIFFIAILENNPAKLNMKKILTELRFHIVFMFIYLAVYFVFQKIYPSQYDANTIGNLNLFAAMKTISIYSVGMFPGTHFVRILLNEGVHVFNEIEILDFVKMILTGIAYFQLIKNGKDKEISKGKQVYYLLIMLMGTVLPCVLYGFTERHVTWTSNGTTSYGASYFSYYFWILLITIFCIWLYRIVKYKRVFVVCSMCIVMAVSFMTSISNRYFSEYFKDNYERYCSFKSLLSSDVFAEIEDASIIYIEGSTGIHGSFGYINSLANKYTGRNYEFVADYEQIDFSRQVYMIKRVDGAWILGWVDSNLETDKICVFLEKGSSGYSLIGQAEEGQEVYIDSQYAGYYDNTFIVPVAEDKDDMAVLEGKKIKMENLQVVDNVLENNAKFTCMPREGFHEKEGNFWWAMNHSVMNIKADDAVKVHISMDVIAAIDTANLKISIADQVYDFVVEPIETKIDIEIQLHEGDNFVNFECDGSILSSAEDSREKVIRIFEPNIFVVE